MEIDATDQLEDAKAPATSLGIYPTLAALELGAYFVPPIGAGVWVEFEAGNQDYPIWAGCRWGTTSDIPTLAKAGNPADPNIVIQSLLQHTFLISDLPPSPAMGGIILKSTAGAMIVVNDSGSTFKTVKALRSR